MMEKAFEILTQAFKACTGWFTSLVNATGSLNFIIAAFGIALVVGLLFMPMRGNNVASWISDYKTGQIHKQQRAYRKAKTEYFKSHTKKKG